MQPSSQDVRVRKDRYKAGISSELGCSRPPLQQPEPGEPDPALFISLGSQWLRDLALFISLAYQRLLYLTLFISIAYQ